jgi:hypothetical protein
MTLARVKVFPDPVTPKRVDLPGRRLTSSLIAAGWLPAGLKGEYREKTLIKTPFLT